MLGKTHLAVAVASALAVAQPENLPILIAGTGAAAVGGLIPDVDVSSSKSHNQVEHIVALTVGAIVLTVVLDFVAGAGIRARLMGNANIAKILIVSLIFIGICGYGAQTAHRSFMHSILACALLSVCILVLMPKVVPYFAVGYASHLFIDLFNKRGEKILFPFPSSFCLNLASSHGVANRLLFIVGSILAGGEFLTFLAFRQY